MWFVFYLFYFFYSRSDFQEFCTPFKVYGKCAIALLNYRDKNSIEL